ncbi:YunG family protein [Saccharopolyspora griseoalba]|uniref:YunG family protein n=1 Tax=Saccharopolyspora griseoalba TaxID=1431848 RepID=UPI0036D27342
MERAIRASWGADTCAPEDVPYWHPGNPARGQCGTTALVLNDLFGGVLVRGDVRRGGEWADYHWWNRFGDGLELDLTREQFAADEHVGPGELVPRPTGGTRLDVQYELLRARVRGQLDR